MKKIIPDLEKKIIDEFMTVAKVLMNEGATDQDIKRAFRNHLHIRRMHYYKHQADLSAVPNLKKAIAALNLKEKADSATEKSFFDYLIESNISFKPQKQIGPYRIDFLIHNNIVFEIDGPHHEQRKKRDAYRDKYLEGLGYHVFRVPVWLINIEPLAIIEEIKNLMLILSCGARC